MVLKFTTRCPSRCFRSCHSIPGRDRQLINAVAPNVRSQLHEVCIGECSTDATWCCGNHHSHQTRHAILASTSYTIFIKRCCCTAQGIVFASEENVSPVFAGKLVPGAVLHQVRVTACELRRGDLIIGPEKTPVCTIGPNYIKWRQVK